MSKPKPGLGKGIVRTLAHSHPNPNPTTTSHHHAHTRAWDGTTSQLVPGLSTFRDGQTQTTVSTTGRGHGKRDSFATLGMPNAQTMPTSSHIHLTGSTTTLTSASTSTLASAPTSTSTSASWSLPGLTSLNQSQPYLSLLPLWDTTTTSSSLDSRSDIVLPFRPLATRPYSTASPRSHRPHQQHRHLSSLASPPLGPLGNLGGTPGDIPPTLLSSLSNLNLSSWPSTLFADKSLSSSSKITSPFMFDTSSPSAPGDGGGTMMNDIVTFLPVPPSPSPAPSIRTSRLSEVHPALSPNAPAPSDVSSTGGSYPFSTLGIPHVSSMDPFVATPTTTEGASLNIYSSNLIFHLGASGSAKERPPPTPSSSAVRSPTPPPRPRSFPLPEVIPPAPGDLRSTGVGEDAYFVRMDGMCIADGVGGWARSGRGRADAGRWSRLLTHFCEVEVGGWWAGKPPYLASTATPTEDKTERGRGGREGRGLSKGDTQDAAGPSGWAKKAWREAGGQQKNMNMEEGKRQPLDPVEIMQRGYEKCLSCVTSEVGTSSLYLTLLSPSETLYID